MIYFLAIKTSQNTDKLGTTSVIFVSFLYLTFLSSDENDIYCIICALVELRNTGLVGLLSKLRKSFACCHVAPHSPALPGLVGCYW